MRDVGYYYFNRNYIQFVVDSAFNDHKLTVVLKINNFKEPAKGVPGQFVEKPHTRYFIKGVDVIPDWKPGESTLYDTIQHQIKFWDDEKDYFYTFLLDEKARLKPAAFNSAIKIKPGKPYSATELEETYRSLFNFRIIRTATVSFDTIGAGKNEEENYSYLNSKVQMQTAKLNSFQAEVEGTNSSGDLGVRGSVVLANRNIFKRADVFSIRVNGGFEAQSVNDSVEGANNGLFNTFEAGVSGNFYFPRFLFPIRATKFNQRYSPITNVNFGFSYQQRPYYNRNITNLDFGYSWNQNKQIKHIITPVTISYVNINIRDSLFKDTINTTPNLRLKEQYSDHMDAGISYSFIYNNQNLLVLEHFNYFRADFQTSGNLLYGVNSWLNSPTDDDGYYNLFNVRYAQYFRVNFDYRHYYYFLNKTNAFVIRVLMGIGIPYGNSKEIPYEKSFFAGGANDMRGWQFRTLGPGGYSGADYYERAGDIQIETNLEYRFPIYDFFKGAFFVDVGNIYTLPKDSVQVIYPNGQFAWDTWYQQLAVDAGVGARFDFSFFIFRIDFAIPLVDPAYWTKENGAQFKFPDGKLFGDIFVVNFGIGYPF
jgi:outer membrane protein assembly factor BamA